MEVRQYKRSRVKFSLSVVTSAGAATRNKWFEQPGQIGFVQCWNFWCRIIVGHSAPIGDYCSLNNAAFAQLLHEQRDHRRYITLTAGGEAGLLNGI